MLSSLKKPSDATVGMPAWHPNFRDVERLPDTKVVRTSFFLNVVSISAALALATYVGYREVKINALNLEVESIRASIDSTKFGSEQAIAAYKKFQEEEKKIQALQAFLAAPKIVYSDFLVNIGASMPSGFGLRGVDFRPAVIVLTGDIEGPSDEASGRANVYIENLKKSEVFKNTFDSIILTSIVKDPGTGKMNFVIEMKFKTPAATKK